MFSMCKRYSNFLVLLFTGMIHISVTTLTIGLSKQFNKKKYCDMDLQSLEDCLKEHIPTNELKEVNRILYGKECMYVLFPVSTSNSFLPMHCT